MTDRTCAVDGCERRVKARGLCRSHYMAERASKMPECTVDGCSKTQHSSGLCSMHYMRVHSGKSIGQGRVERKRCSVADCQRVVTADGYCQYHSKRIELGLPMNAPLPKRGRTTCQIEGCSEYVSGEGYCKAHLRRFRRGVQVEFERTPKVPTPCIACGRTFTPANHGQKTCGRKCKTRASRGQSTEIVKTCSMCSSVFVLSIDGSGSTSAKFCPACRPLARVAVKAHSRRAYKARKAAAPVTGEVTIEMLRRVFGDHCHICRKPIDFSLSPRHRMSATIDHLIPLSRVELGPWHGPGNVMLAHFKCNSAKRNRIVHQPTLPLVA